MTNPTNNGRGDTHKFDYGKPMWDLLPWKETEEIVKVLTYGASKYSYEGWKKVPDAKKRIFAAMIRHLTAWKKGERIDVESGYQHLAHAGCCLLFLMWHDHEDVL